MQRWLLASVLVAAVARSSTAQPEVPPDAPVPVAAPPSVVGPCGTFDPDPAKDYTVACSTQRLAPSSAGSLYADFISLRDRGGLTIGARVLTTLSTQMRREAVELHAGSVKDRGAAFRIHVRATRADLHDGGIDRGIEVGGALLAMSRRWHAGIEAGGVFGVSFGLDNYSLGGALLGEYELLATDRFAVVGMGRAGLDFYTAMERTGEETRFAPYIGVALGVSLFTRGP